MSPLPLEFSRHAERLQAYLDVLTQAAGHADRVIPMENYTKGLMLPIARKSVEPMAARLAPGKVRQMHQSLHHIVADAALERYRTADGSTPPGADRYDATARAGGLDRG